MDQQSLGWVKLHRELLDNPMTHKSDYLALWIILLLRANHKESSIIIDGKKMPIMPGQFITSRRKLSLLSGISESKIQRALKCYENEHQIKQQTFSKFRLISIVNWDKYQENEHQIKQQVNNKRTPSEHQVNTNKNDKKVKNDKKEDLVQKKSNPQIKEFIDFAFQKTKEITGTDLIIKKTNEPPLVKHLLGTIKLDRLKLLWEYFITEDFENDDWLEKAGKTITSFNTKINMLNQNYNGWMAKQRYERSK